MPFLASNGAIDFPAAMRDLRCRSSAPAIARSLQGSYRPEHLFSLQKAVGLYEFHQEKIADCERQIMEQLRSFRCPGTGGQVGRRKRVSNTSIKSIIECTWS